MKKIILGLALISSMSAFARNSVDRYVPKNSSQQDQLLAAAQESLKFHQIKSYEGQSNKRIQRKLHSTAMSIGEIKAAQSFSLNNNSERFVTCSGRIVKRISNESLQFGNPSYDGFLSQVVEANPDVQAPLVLMGCDEYSLDTRMKDGDFAGRVLFEIDNDGNIVKTLKD